MINTAEMVWIFFVLNIAVVYVIGVPFNVVTFNTGLTSRISHYDQRRLAVGMALKGLKADVVCLQEVWNSKDMTEILKSLKSTDYRYSYSYLHDDVSKLHTVSRNEAPCASSSFKTIFLPCLKKRCNQPTNQTAYLKCAERCEMLNRVDQECIACLILSDPKTALQGCMGNRGDRFNIPGIMLLSKRPIEDPKLTFYEAKKKLLIPRAYISAKISEVGNIFCTHTTANLHMPYFEELDYESWNSQNVHEANVLGELIKIVPKGLVMGDLNGGPEVFQTEVVADFEDAYDALLRSGLTPSYVSNLGICTWCVYNPLTNYRVNKILDHVFVKNITVNGVMRIFDRNIEGRDYPLSDHFGVQVAFEV